MKHTKLDIIKSWFKINNFAFWWNRYTDYELQLSRMSISELASELNRTKVRNETENTIIVEYVLASRIAKLQSRASWWAGWIGFAGAMLAVLLTFYLGRWSITSEPRTNPESKTITINQERIIEKPIPTATSIIEVAPRTETVKPHSDNKDTK